MTPALLALALQAAPDAQGPAPVAPPPTTQPAAPAATTTPPAPAQEPPPVAEPTIPAPPPTTTTAPSQPYNYPETATSTPPAPVTPLSPAIPPPNSPLNAPPTATGVPDDIKYRRLVFAGLVTLNFSIETAVPSGDFQFFLGTNLRPRKRARGGQWNTAIGYQLGLSVGHADLATLEFSSEDPNLNDFESFAPVFYHRHHITAMGHGGKRGRLYYSFGGGALIWQTTPFAVEGETRLGYVFFAPEGRRAKGVIGGQARLSGGFGGIPLPQFGLFAGAFVF